MCVIIKFLYFSEFLDNNLGHAGGQRVKKFFSESLVSLLIFACLPTHPKNAMPFDLSKYMGREKKEAKRWLSINEMTDALLHIKHKNAEHIHFN